MNNVENKIRKFFNPVRDYYINIAWNNSNFICKDAIWQELLYKMSDNIRGNIRDAIDKNIEIYNEISPSTKHHIKQKIKTSEK